MYRVLIFFLVFCSTHIKAQETASFLFNKGFNYILVDKVEAIKYFSQSLEKDPQFSLAFYYRGLAHYKLGQYGMAIKDFDDAIASDNNMVKCYMYRGFAYQQLNNTQLALESFESYMDNKSEITDTDHLVLAKAKAANGDFKGALKEYENALDEKPTEDQLYHLFLATYQQEKYKDALSLINKIIKLNPTFYGYYLHKGKVELNIKHFDLALLNFDKSLGLNPQVADSYFLKGNTLDTLGRFDEALVNYSTAIQLNPTDGTYYSKRGNTRLALGNKNGACLDWTVAGKLGYYADFDKIKTVCEQTTIYSK